MQRCLQIAANGFGLTRSNPMVGCVIVYEDKIISEGYHKAFGLPHAEVEAINLIKDKTILHQCTLYVNLEPCSHFGKTPPCTELIISKGIKKIVVGSLDPNPLVNGQGIAKLIAAGVDVVQGIMDNENKILNKRFYTFHTKKRPFIILKWAQSRDGFIAPFNYKGSYKLTNSLSNSLVHSWRAQEMGILVGRKTIENDNPLLTVRNADGQNPVRIILDRQNKLDGNCLVFNEDSPTFFFNTQLNEIKKNVEKISVDEDKFLENVLKVIHERNISSILVEGGEKTLSSFINVGLWDEARIFTTEEVLTNGVKAPIIEGNKVDETVIQQDNLTYLIP